VANLHTLKNNWRKLGLRTVDDQFFGGLKDTLVISATENATPSAKNQLRINIIVIMFLNIQGISFMQQPRLCIEYQKDLLITRIRWV